MNRFSVEAADPRDPELDLLFARHSEFCHADTPPESMHMMDRADLAAPGIRFLILRGEEAPLAMGALKSLGDGTVELKSMHVLEEARGSGAARHMLGALSDAARGMGATAICLETGAQPSFAPARAFYGRAGFAACGPFGSYDEDPMSLFMRLEISAKGEARSG